jgi:hypothetical protein
MRSNADPVELALVFGLLDSKPVKSSNQQLKKVYTLDYFRVTEYETYAEFVCKCGRSKPYTLEIKDLSKIRSSFGFFGCYHCLLEVKEAHSYSDKISTWIIQNKADINKTAHLYIPEGFSRLIDKDKIMRPRRFVYSKFFDVTLSKEQKILCTCNDTNCVNPYHMMVAASAATKITPDIKKDVFTWFSKNISPRVIQQMLEMKYNLSVSLKTITNLKNSKPA